MNGQIQKQSPQQRAKLRVCMSCEWIYIDHKNASDARTDEDDIGRCPKCNWPSYGARFVYGDKAYRYAVTQKPWFDKKMSDYACKLHGEMQALNKRKKRSLRLNGITL